MSQVFAKRLAGFLLGTLCMALQAHAADVATPAEASVALYERISAKDLDGVLRLLPPAGFSEIGADGAAIHQLNRQAFEAFFGSGAEIALRAGDLKVQDFGDTAIVTGIRSGGVAPRGGTPGEGRRLFTMVWRKGGAGWQLVHLHLSETR